MTGRTCRPVPGIKRAGVKGSQWPGPPDLRGPARPVSRGPIDLAVGWRKR